MAYLVHFLMQNVFYGRILSMQVEQFCLAFSCALHLSWLHVR